MSTGAEKEEVYDDEKQQDRRRMVMPHSTEHVIPGSAVLIPLEGGRQQPPLPAGSRLK